MNILKRVRKDLTISSLVPLKYLMYATIISDVERREHKGIYRAVCTMDELELSEVYSDFDDEGSDDSEFVLAIKSLEEEGLIQIDEEGIIYVGEFRGRKFFPFEETKTSSDAGKDLLFAYIDESLERATVHRRSRIMFLKDRIEEILGKGIERLNPKDFTDIHVLLYEVYMEEPYIIRNKTEYYQTNNILKAYTKQNALLIIVEGIINFHKYKTRGIPTLTNVAMLKDDIFKALKDPSKGSKEYMRTIKTTVSDGGF